MAMNRQVDAQLKRWCPSTHPRQAQQAVMVRCQAQFRTYKSQLAAAATAAAAATPCILALQTCLQFAPPAQAYQTSRLLPEDHELTVSRSAVENILLQQMSGRLHTLSDDELLKLLEQMQSNTFPAQLLLPGNGHSTSHPGNSKSSPSAAGVDDLHQEVLPFHSAELGTRGARSSSSKLPQQSKADSASSQNNQTRPPEDAEADAEQMRRQETGAQPSREAAALQDQAAAGQDAHPFDDWKYRLQAFAKPLMQQIPGQQQLQQDGKGHAVDNSTAQGSMRPQTAPSGVSSEALAGRQQPQQQQLESGRAASDNASTQTDALPSDVSTNGAGEQQLGQQASDSTSSYSSPMSMLRQRGNAERPIREQAAEKEASDEQDPLSDQQKVEDRSRQALDEAEDSTSKMLQSSGVTVPSSVVDLGRENQASRYTRAGNGLSPVVNAYLEASWKRALPQLALLAATVTASTLSVLAAQAAALKTAQSLQGISTDPSARPDDSAIASTAPRPQSAEAGTARAVDAGSTTPSSEDADSSVWLRLWRSTKKALQPVLTSGLQRFGKRSASTAKEGVAQAAVLDAPTGHEVMYKQQTANQEKFSQGLHNTSHSDRDEWGRLVLHVNGAAGSSNGMGNIVPLVEQVPSAREDVSSPNTILWVRQEPDDQQEQQLPLQNQEQRSGPANGAVHHAQHQNGSERNNRPSQEPPRIRLRHRRFSGKEISREALLDNVE